jgi:molybdopterin converting factor subunit 1
LRIRTLFFASFKDLVGTGRIDLDVPDGTTVAGLVSALRKRGGTWEKLPAEPAVAVNLEYSELSRALHHGDEVAVIPPVAGG